MMAGRPERKGNTDMEDKQKQVCVEPEQAPEAEPGKEPGADTSEKKREKKETKEQLLSDIEALQAKLLEQEDIYKRMLAEYANYKRRTEQEKEQIGEFSRGETLRALLPVLDNLGRAVAAPEGPEYKTGVDMTIRQLGEALKALGLEEIEALGKPFDPEIHHAVMREDADGVEPETVTEVLQTGYVLHGRVLRPAMVKVAN